MQTLDEVMDEIQPGHCDFSRAHDDAPHLKEDCGDPDTWEPEYDGPPDELPGGGTWYHSQWEAMHPKVER